MPLPDSIGTRAIVWPTASSWAGRSCLGCGISKALRGFIGELCRENNVAGHRADLVLEQAARALAALEGKAEVSAEHIGKVAPLVLLHRRRDAQPPPPPPPEPPQPEEQEEQDQEEQAEQQEQQQPEENPESQVAPPPSQPQQQGEQESRPEEQAREDEGQQGQSSPDR